MAVTPCSCKRFGERTWFRKSRQSASSPRVSCFAAAAAASAFAAWSQAACLATSASAARSSASAALRHHPNNQIFRGGAHPCMLFSACRLSCRRQRMHMKSPTQRNNGTCPPPRVPAQPRRRPAAPCPGRPQQRPRAARPPHPTVPPPRGPAGRSPRAPLCRAGAACLSLPHARRSGGCAGWGALRRRWRADCIKTSTTRRWRASHLPLAAVCADEVDRSGSATSQLSSCTAAAPAQA